MGPTIKETTVETQGEETNLETYGASKSHTVTGTVSENRNLIRNRGKHDNAKAVSWTSRTMAPPTSDETVDGNEETFIRIINAHNSILNGQNGHGECQPLTEG